MADLAGKLAVVTGGNSGIGKETVVELAQMGAHVVIGARNPDKAAAAVKEVKERTQCGERVETMPIDLASFASVRAFADAFSSRHERCDILVNNAGGMLTKRRVTADGHEMQFQVNHLSHFLLTNLLRRQLKRGDARIVNVASEAHRTARGGLKFADLDWAHRRYRGFRAYSDTKLMNILFTRELARRWAGTGVTANAVHPGFVASNFGRDGDTWWGNIAMPLVRPFALSVAQGAVTSVYVASSPDIEGITGQYFAKSSVTVPAATALDDGAATKLWELSAQLTGVDSPSSS